MSFSAWFRDVRREHAVLKEMALKSTRDAFGGQFFVVKFEGLVDGDGSDGSTLLLDKLTIISPASRSSFLGWLA
ncbi:hypothetical protein [Sphingomonas sp.]|uniref:hypothetical protein n=1 Tax=Sphingomonas sp. TaxID=28214 RepID=UPI00286AF35E|nr:hypothetical protein [Sphingomonas sp.]